jgi:hypothetical protein
VCPGWVQTDLGGPDNRAAAPTTAATAARIVAQMAMIDDNGPTGGSSTATGPSPGEVPLHGLSVVIRRDQLDAIGVGERGRGRGRGA